MENNLSDQCIPDFAPEAREGLLKMTTLQTPTAQQMIHLMILEYHIGDNYGFGVLSDRSAHKCACSCHTERCHIQ